MVWFHLPKSNFNSCKRITKCHKQKLFGMFLEWKICIRSGHHTPGVHGELGAASASDIKVWVWLTDYEDCRVGGLTYCSALKELLARQSLATCTINFKTKTTKSVPGKAKTSSVDSILKYILEFHHLLRVGPKQLCELAHQGCIEWIISSHLIFWL